MMTPGGVPMWCWIRWVHPGSWEMSQNWSTNSMRSCCCAGVNFGPLWISSAGHATETEDSRSRLHLAFQKLFGIIVSLCTYWAPSGSNLWDLLTTPWYRGLANTPEIYRKHWGWVGVPSPQFGTPRVGLVHCTFTTALTLLVISCMSQTYSLTKQNEDGCTIQSSLTMSSKPLGCHLNSSSKEVNPVETWGVYWTVIRM